MPILDVSTMTSYRVTICNSGEAWVKAGNRFVGKVFKVRRGSWYAEDAYACQIAKGNRYTNRKNAVDAVIAKDRERLLEERRAR